MGSRLPATEFLRLYRHRFEYRDGKLLWAESPTNSVPAGSEVGTLQTFKRTGKVYRYANVGWRRYPVHQIIYALHCGCWAEPELDHRNGDSLDNRIENLRPSTRSENSRNHSMNKRNTSGVTGVSWMPSKGKWRVWITINRKHIHIGVYSDFDDAVAARKQAEREEGYSERHGSPKPVDKFHQLMRERPPWAFDLPVECESHASRRYGK